MTYDRVMKRKGTPAPSIDWDGPGAMDAGNPLPAIIARIRQVAAPTRIVLFGSRARGEAAPDSDYDLLVVLPGSIDRKAETLRLMRAFRGEPIPIDLVVIGESDVDPLRARLTSVVRAALEEGRVLYAA